MFEKCMVIPTPKEDTSDPMNGRGIGPGIPCLRNIPKGQMPYLSLKKRWGGGYGEKLTSAIKARRQS